MRVAVIPALNEGRTVGTIVLRTKKYVDLVLVVDDGSTDDTADIAAAAGAEVVSHGANKGKGAALATGMKVALRRNATVLVLLDSDGQHDPYSIPALVAPIEAGVADLVIGARTLQGDGTVKAMRKAGRRVLDRATNMVGGTAVSDTQSGFRAISAKAAHTLAPRENGMGVESVMLAAAARQGLTVVEVAVSEHYPVGVQPSMHPARHGASVLSSLLRFVREEHPLAFFGSIGTVMFAYGAYAGYATAAHYYATDEFWLGKAMQSMLFLILGSIALLGAVLLDFISIKFRGRAGE